MNNPQPLEIRRVNPECLLEAANKAEPNSGWKINAAGDVYKITHGCGVSFRPLSDSIQGQAFVHSLMLALMDEKNGNWEFGKARGQFHARKIDGPVTTYMCDESAALLAMRCVAFDTGLPVYLEE